MGDLGCPLRLEEDRNAQVDPRGCGPASRLGAGRFGSRAAAGRAARDAAWRTARGAPGAPPFVPSVAPPPAKPEVRPTGTAASVNGQVIPEVAVYRALRQFPDQHKEMARKEIMAHLIENALIDQYLTALKITVEEKDVEKLIVDLKKELTDAKKDYLKELDAMMLTEAEFRVEVVAQMKWEKFIQQQGTDAA